MNNPISLTPLQIAGVFLAVCGAIASIGKASEYVLKLISAAKKPETKQNDRITTLEERMDKVETALHDHDKFFANDKELLDEIKEGMHVLQRASLATLSHAINGNDVDRLKETVKELQDYLTKN